MAFRTLFGVFGLFFFCACGPVEQERAVPGTAAGVARVGSVVLRDTPDLIFSRQNGTGATGSISRGTDEFLQPIEERTTEGITIGAHDGPGIDIELLNVSVQTAAAAILGETLNLPYAIEDGVEGTITVQSSSPLSPESLLETFQTVLELNGATLTSRGDVVVITRLANAISRFQVGQLTGFGRNVIVIPLRFISASEMLRLLQPIVAQDAIVDVSTGRNLLFVSGTRDEIDAILDAVNLFDIDVLEGKSTALFPLEFASPDVVSQELLQIFDAAEGGALEGVVSFIPNERLGSVLVISSRARYIDEAASWIGRLDSTAGRSERYARAYDLRNRTASDLQPVLSELLEAVEADEAEFGGPSRVPPRLVADEVNNAVLVYATDTEHEEIARLIARLDVTPPQVLIEATIAEVTLTDELALGVRWFFESGNFQTQFSDLTSGGITTSAPGFSTLFRSGEARVALSALSAITEVNVASTPSLLVLDNREAELRVGDQVPVATQTATDLTNPNAPSVNEISFRDTGVILRIRPRVGDGGRIVMDIEQEVSDVVSTTSSGIDSPTISQRRISTSVAVVDGQTLVLGGLIEDNRQIVNQQVPGLGDIPIIGAAFRNREDEERRTELLILIKPSVIRDPVEAQLITDAFRQNLVGPDRLLRSPTQPQHTLDRLLR